MGFHQLQCKPYTSTAGFDPPISAKGPVIEPSKPHHKRWKLPKPSSMAGQGWEGEYRQSQGVGSEHAASLHSDSMESQHDVTSCCHSMLSLCLKSQTCHSDWRLSPQLPTHRSCPQQSDPPHAKPTLMVNNEQLWCRQHLEIFVWPLWTRKKFNPPVDPPPAYAARLEVQN